MLWELDNLDPYFLDRINFWGFGQGMGMKPKYNWVLNMGMGVIPKYYWVLGLS